MRLLRKFCWKNKLGEKIPETKKMMKNFCLEKKRKRFSERNFQEKNFPQIFFGATLRKKSWWKFFSEKMFAKKCWRKKIQKKIAGQNILREILVERFLWGNVGEKFWWKPPLIAGWLGFTEAQRHTKKHKATPSHYWFFIAPATWRQGCGYGTKR